MAAPAERPDTPEQDLWSSILDSVSKSRSTPSKQILLLGEPRTGKTTLATALLQKKIDKDDAKDEFALGFDWSDVRDDADEDTIARLSVYNVQSSNAVHTTLLEHVLPPKTAIPNTLVMIILDWTKPWTFVEQLEIWLKWVEKWAKGDGSRELEVLREEGKDRLHYHLQHYTEPTDEPLLTTLASSSLPLPQGTFTSNTAGVPIVVVCTKADLIDDNSDIAGVGAGGMGGMVKSKGGEWEERTDGVMQVLRTVCLKYGAGLFYSTQVPATAAVLRQYALHTLFAPPPPQPTMGSSDAPAPARNPFPFSHPANALDRDRIVVPAGWDSWGKIKILRDDFEPVRWSDAWDRDMENFALAPPAGVPSTQKLASSSVAWAAEASLAPPIPHGARSNFITLVGPDRGPAPRSLPPIIQPTPEQAFLQQHYETLAKDRDPRGAFIRPAVAVDGASIIGSAGGAGGVGVGVVGPLGSSSFSLPSVEKALVEMEGGTDKDRERERNDRDKEKIGLAVRAAAGGGTSARRDGKSGPAALQTSGGSQASRPLVSPTALGGSKGETQHEVLHKFFQSLLTSRTGSSGSATNAGTGPGATSTAATRTNTNADGGVDGQTDGAV